MKGPMTTQTLRGTAGTDPLHWRGDRASFLDFNPAFDGLLGGTVLTTADMNAYRDYINTVKYHPNPNQNLDRSLPVTFNGGDPIAGRNTYINEQYQTGLACNTCHALPTGTNSTLIPAAALQESQAFKVPQLRNQYQKTLFNTAAGASSVDGFGLTHDGVDPNLFVFISRPVFGVFANDTVRKNNIAAFVLCLDTGTAPAVGYTRTINSAALANTLAMAEWTILEQQATAFNCDLIVKGTIDGAVHGLRYDPVGQMYVCDFATAPLTHAQLVAKIQAGDVLTVMGVPKGSGQRMGIDRDMDGTPDSLDTSAVAGRTAIIADISPAVANPDGTTVSTADPRPGKRKGQVPAGH